jgi:hypothetical protein
MVPYVTSTFVLIHANQFAADRPQSTKMPKTENPKILLN